MNAMNWPGGSFPQAGFDRAQEIMALGERHGWRMLCHPQANGWTQLEFWRDSEYLQINWVERNGRAKLAATRQYRTADSLRHTFSLAEARRIIAQPRCARCGGTCTWTDDAWVCDRCGDEWYPGHGAEYQIPGGEQL